MKDRLETLKYTFTVEGETEKWYLDWLSEQINKCEKRNYNVSFVAKIQQSPKKFYKGTNSKTTPLVTHICDVESNDKVHVDKFMNILSEMKEAKEQKKIKYTLGYSNYTFELWIILHKKSCNGSLTNRKQYLDPINQIFEENFEDLDKYKHEDDFKRCLRKLSIDDVISAIKRADVIMNNNIKDDKKVISYKTYSYYKDNPALSIHDVIRNIFFDCGILVKKK